MPAVAIRASGVRRFVVDRLLEGREEVLGLAWRALTRTVTHPARYFDRHCLSLVFSLPFRRQDRAFPCGTAARSGRSMCM